ncbi:MAG: hypothetical protein BroJett040_05730 [Oligoflexia bacterium]|nr:MAG: hypothetical protein BroJett040_05730 [Oligoflexia bacterium]
MSKQKIPAQGYRRVPGSSRQDNLPIIKASLFIGSAMFAGFLYLLLQLIGF